MKNKEDNYQKQIQEINKGAGDQREKKREDAKRINFDKTNLNPQQPTTSTSKKSNSPKL